MEDIERAADVILNGGVVLLPTDTVFGLSANAFDSRAIEKIYQIKNRDKNKPLPVLIADYTDLLKLTETPSELEGELIKKFWPGPLTVVLKLKEGITSPAFFGKDAVAARMPNSELVRNLIHEAGVPLATTSANISGERAVSNLDEVDEKILDRVDFVLENPEDFEALDGSSGVASTIVQVVDDDLKILRPGTISEEEIRKVCNF